MTDTHTRRSIRIPRFDDTRAFWYFLTLCARDRDHLFGRIDKGKMIESPIGNIVLSEWRRTKRVRPGVELDVMVLMPNHFHAVIAMGRAPSGADVVRSCGTKPGVVGSHSVRPPRSLGSFVAGFKSAVTSLVMREKLLAGPFVWQRNYYEHVIRDERELGLVRQYIIDNPFKWHLDRENPYRTGKDPEDDRYY